MQATHNSGPQINSQGASSTLNDVLPEAVAKAVAVVIVDLKRQWTKELEIITAKADAAIADLKAQIAGLVANVKDGKDGVDGKAGAPGENGARGEPGLSGVAGPAGEPGRDGLPGVPGRDGLNGKDGVDGLNGKDGVDGVTVQKVAAYRGVWKDGETYELGDFVSWAGSLWHCDALENIAKPGGDGDNWTLAVKRGRDGKEGKAGDPGPQGPRGLSGKDGF